jgi:hypothetical protein
MVVSSILLHHGHDMVFWLYLICALRFVAIRWARALARESALEPNELLTAKRAGVTSPSPTANKTHQPPYSKIMASTGSESPSKAKRSRAEMEADDHPMAPAAPINDGVIF